MNKKSQVKYEQCLEILQSINEVIAIVIQDIEMADLTPMEIILESVNALSVYSRLSPEERAVVEEDTNRMLDQLRDQLEAEAVKVVDNRTDATPKTKKTLLN